MKKTLIAMGVLGAFSSLAFAASNVTLYGIIEEWIFLIISAGFSQISVSVL